jgi:hypothetical protein
MKPLPAVCFLAGLFVAVTLRAQTSPQAPAPSPELKKQDYFVGDWTLEGTTRASAYGPGGQKFKSTEHLEWMSGGFFLLAHAYHDKKLVAVTVIGYDSSNKTFTHTAFNSRGETELWTGTADDDKWTWTRDAQIGGKPVRDRLTITRTSANSYAFVVEVQPAQGGDWSIVAEGTGTRAG